MINSPCYECAARVLGCHTDCEKYAAWVAQNAEQAARRRIPADADAHTKETIYRNCKRAKTKRQVGRK